jgi:hypothetical protein
VTDDVLSFARCKRRSFSNNLYGYIANADSSGSATERVSMCGQGRGADLVGHCLVPFPFDRFSVFEGVFFPVDSERIPS